MAKIPSLQQLFTGFTATLKRFPLELLVSVIGSVAFMLLIETHYNQKFEKEILLRSMLVSVLGLTLFLSTSLYAERKNLSSKNSILLKVVAVVLVVGLFFFLRPIDSIVSVFRYGFLIVALHLLVSLFRLLEKKILQLFGNTINGCSSEFYCQVCTARYYSQDYALLYSASKPCLSFILTRMYLEILPQSCTEFSTLLFSSRVFLQTGQSWKNHTHTRRD